MLPAYTVPTTGTLGHRGQPRLTRLDGDGLLIRWGHLGNVIERGSILRRKKWENQGRTLLPPPARQAFYLSPRWGPALQLPKAPPGEPRGLTPTARRTLWRRGRKSTP